MKKCICLILLIIFSSTAVFANEGNASINPKPDSFADNESENETSPSFSAGQRVGFGFLNLFFGLGSFLMRDWWSGIQISLFEIIGYPCLYVGISILIPYWDSKNKGPVDLLLYSMGMPFFAIGIIGTVGAWIMSFLYPAIYGTPLQRVLNRNPFIDLKNWSFNFLLNEKGRINGQILFAINL